MSFDGEAFGHRVRAARVWAGLEPKELALQLGVSDEAVYQLERGERRRSPRRGELELLSRVLGQSEAWLLDGDEPPWRTATAGASGDLELAEVAEEVADVLDRLRTIASAREQS